MEDMMRDDIELVEWLPVSSTSFSEHSIPMTIGDDEHHVTEQKLYQSNTSSLPSVRLRRSSSLLESDSPVAYTPSNESTLPDRPCACPEQLRVLDELRSKISHLDQRFSALESSVIPLIKLVMDRFADPNSALSKLDSPSTPQPLAPMFPSSNTYTSTERDTSGNIKPKTAVSATHHLDKSDLPRREISADQSSYCGTPNPGIRTSHDPDVHSRMEGPGKPAFRPPTSSSAVDISFSTKVADESDVIDLVDSDPSPEDLFDNTVVLVPTPHDVNPSIKDHSEGLARYFKPQKNSNQLCIGQVYSLAEEPPTTSKHDHQKSSRHNQGFNNEVFKRANFKWTPTKIDLTNISKELALAKRTPGRCLVCDFINPSFSSWFCRHCQNFLTRQVLNYRQGKSLRTCAHRGTYPKCGPCHRYRFQKAWAQMERDLPFPLPPMPEVHFRKRTVESI